MKKTIHIVCAARPNFMKIAPLFHALTKEDWCSPQIIHTGQHYDYKMSQTFFDEFNLPAPHFYLSVGSGTHAEQTAQTMIAYEKLCLTESKPDLVIVVGDVNATLACSITAKKLNLKVAHLEAGLRSFDREMPEEINRIITDSICDYFWTPSVDADQNLLNEGAKKEQISFVGNIMIDTFCMMKAKIIEKESFKTFDLEKGRYVVLTIHRPSNVDNLDSLEKIISSISKVECPVIFPVHPRTRKNLEKLSMIPQNLKLTDPLGYIDFMNLVMNARFVVSDSGGIQEETTYLQIPCFTLRDNTERPITVTMGSNQLVNSINIVDKIKSPKTGEIPPLWDGKTSERVVIIIKEILHGRA